MEVSGQILANIGILYWVILLTSVTFGWLRSDKILIIHFVLGCIMLYYGIQFLQLNLPCKGNTNGAGFLFGPIVFIVSYSLLRVLFKKIYKFEPDIEAYSRYSSRDSRALNFMDYVVFLVPSMLSAIVNLSLAN